MTYEECEQHAKRHGYVLSDHANGIIRMINGNDGKCPCKKGEVDQICPCDDHHDEISKSGSCTCSLFIGNVDSSSK